MPNPTASMLVIGDEILSGRTRDSNMHYLAQHLTKMGIDLREVRVVLDITEDIVDSVQILSKRYDYVFTSGGIGPTHDDITTDAIGIAFGVKVEIQNEARVILEKNYRGKGLELNESRLRMARIPCGAILINNSISAAPGYNIFNVFVMAGVPSVFQAMVDSVLPSLLVGTPIQSRTLTVMRGEGEIALKLKKFAKKNQNMSFGSYPFQLDGEYGTNIVIRGTDPVTLDGLCGALLDQLLKENHES